MTLEIRSDQQLMAGIRQKDPAAFEVLLLRHRSAVVRHLVSMLRDPDAADDLAQDVFLRVWTHAEQWDGRGSFTGWLYRIATNLALNLLRTIRRRREQAVVISDSEDDSEITMPDWLVDKAALSPEEALEASAQHGLLCEMINDLPEKKRRVFHMAHEAEMDIAEIAEALGVPEGTVKSRLHHARKDLAYKWQDAAMEWEDI